jgi:CBS domain-containing protein
MRAADLMTRNVVTVTPETRVEDLCDLFRERRITGAPVVDGEGRLVGIVSKDDVIFRRQGGAGDRPRQEADIGTLFTGGFVGFAPASGNGDARVADIMTRDVISAPEDARIEDLCRLMWDRRVHRIPIVSGAVLVGIVSALDICRGVVQGTLRGA